MEGRRTSCSEYVVNLIFLLISISTPVLINYFSVDDEAK